HALDVAVENGLALAEGKGDDGGSSRAADAGQLLHRREILGKAAAVLAHDALRRGMQVARARIVAKTAPVLQHLVLRSLRQAGDIGEAADETLVVADDGGDLRLLQHDLGHPDGVRVARVLPWQVVAAVGLLPGNETGGKIGHAAIPEWRRLRL